MVAIKGKLPLLQKDKGKSTSREANMIFLQLKSSEELRNSKCRGRGGGVSGIGMRAANIGDGRGRGDSYFFVITIKK